MSKKSRKAKLAIPKRIAGVKVPKALRRGRFGELLASPKGQAAIAEALLGVGAVAAGVKKARGNPRVKAKVADATAQAGAAGSAVAFALGQAARTFVEALRTPLPAGRSEDDEPAWAADYGAPRPEGRPAPPPQGHA